MNKNRRNYIKENGRTALRKMSNKKSPPRFFDKNGKNCSQAESIGSVYKCWSPIYCEWGNEVTISCGGLVLKYAPYGMDEADLITYALAKYQAIKNPRFPSMLQLLLITSEFSHEDIAEIIGVTKGAISKWVAGEAYPSINSLLRICKLLHAENWEKHYTELSKVIELERI